MSVCIKCGVYLPEGYGMVCKHCENEIPQDLIPSTVINNYTIDDRFVSLRCHRTRTENVLYINTGDEVIMIKDDNIKKLVRGIIQEFDIKINI